MKEFTKNGFLTFYEIEDKIDIRIKIELKIKTNPLKFKVNSFGKSTLMIVQPFMN